MLENIEMTRLIPHREPLILLDKVISSDAEGIECQVEITPKSFLCEDGRVPAYAGMEYIAQSIAAFSGVTNLDSGKDPEIGFLLGVRKFQSTIPYFKLGDVLTVKSNVVFFEGSLGSFSGSIEVEGKTVITTNLSTFRPTKQQFDELKENVYGK